MSMQEWTGTEVAQMSGQAPLPESGGSHSEDRTYDRIAKAIAYIDEHFQEQPSLDDIASAIGMSRFHFQRLFSEWAGVSPKKFMQYMSLEYAKTLLKDGKTSLLDAAYATGLSGTGRLHDLFVHIERMTPGEYKRGGEGLEINYCFADSPFGRLLVAATNKGVCHMGFADDETAALDELRQQFPSASYEQVVDRFQQEALFVFQEDWHALDKIRLHLKGSPFQLKVWECLLKIPAGQLASYGDVARAIGQPKSSRAVGTAVGDKPGGVPDPLPPRDPRQRQSWRLPLGGNAQGGDCWLGGCARRRCVACPAAFQPLLPEAQRLSHVRRFDIVGSLQIRQRSRHACRAMHGARRQPQRVGGVFPEAASHRRRAGSVARWLLRQDAH